MTYLEPSRLDPALATAGDKRDACEPPGGRHMSALQTAVTAVTNGEDIRPDDLVALLCVDSKEERYRVNAALASAYFKSQRIERAGDFADRAWLLSGASSDFVPVYLEIQAALGNWEGIRQAHKRVGMRHAAAGNVLEALHHFNLHHYAYQRTGQGDRYDYDFEILDAVESLAKRHQLRVPPCRDDGTGSPVRIAYLVFGATHSESVLIKLLCYFARHHDPSRFVARFFVPDGGTKADPDTNRILESNLERLSSNGATIAIPQAHGELDSLREMVRKLAEFQPQLLVTTAALADYTHYFLASTGAAAVRVGLVYGPPEQFVAPGFDWVVTATKHPLMDSPSNATLVPIEVDLPDLGSVPAHGRSEFGIPEDAILLMAVGRPEKFIDPAYWRALSGILTSHRNAFLLIVGLSEPPEFLGDEFEPSASSRLRLIGYRTDYLRVLAMADVVVDTFPSGGGVVLLDAMAFGIPVVTFRNDYGRRFDQTRWSPGEELFDVDALIVARGDFDRFAAVVANLIEDTDHRRRMGRKCRDSVLRVNGQPERMVRRHERIYEYVLETYHRRQESMSGTPKESLFRHALERVRRAGKRVLRAVSGKTPD